MTLVAGVAAGILLTALATIFDRSVRRLPHAVGLLALMLAHGIAAAVLAASVVADR